MKRSTKRVDRPGLAVPEPAPTPAPAEGGLKGIVVSRHRQRQLEIALFSGSLTAVPSRAYLLGLFEGVAPAGAASAVDALMGGAVRDFVGRRMLSGRLGEVFIVPKGRSFVLADHVLFVGLGAFDRFHAALQAEGGEVMRLVCESVVRTCLHANVEEFATVLLGGSAAAGTESAVELFTRSFLDALRTADPQRRIRRVTLCENDRERVRAIRAELLRLATTDMFEEVELELRDLPASAVSAPGATGGGATPSARPSPVYLLTRMFAGEETADGSPGGDQRRPSRGRKPLPKGNGKGTGKGTGPGALELETSLLLPESKAAILTVRRRIETVGRDAVLSRMGAGGFSATVLEEIGLGLVDLAFEEGTKDSVLQRAMKYRDRPLVVVHDAVASQLPWESFRYGDWRPALEGGISRQHLDANLSVAKWIEERALQPTLEVLMITNPTEDLEGAEIEGRMIRDLLSNVANVSLTERRGDAATRDQILRDFRTGRFDVVHYAGHAFFAPEQPGRSGLLCAGAEILSGVDVAGLSHLPSLIFFNACEAGRIRGARKDGNMGSARNRGKDPRSRAPKGTGGDAANLSVAAAFIRGGVANFLGTYWPVGDDAAEVFSRAFYPALVAGRAIGDAVLEGRRAVEARGSADWADYLFYGNPEFVLKVRK
ncbi:MAG: CHAT domain-containing protein [Limisphaerales bacterium]